tara:strand:- start:1212 stop:1733 length:522 start_codon:yes stop_codon:yes gene_type:complete
MSEELKLISQIENMIYVIRGQRVMMDSDLANLYGVELKRLNEQVRRNSERFPNDFMFECNLDELQDLRSQFATANPLNTWNHMRRSPPMLFTELGVAMLSSVLNSKQAVAINIEIMRIFVRLRSFHAIDPNQRIDELEQGTNALFKTVFQRLDDLDEKTTPLISKNRKRIGLK